MMKDPILSQRLTLRRKLQRTSLENFRVIVLLLCRDYAHLPLTSEIKRLLKARDFTGLVEYADFLSEQKYSDATMHYVANQFALLIRKYPYPKSVVSFDPERTAYEKFVKAEASCHRYNRLFRLRRSRKEKPVRYEFQFQAMRDFIRYTIGDTPSKTEIWNRAGFGPGASIGTNGNATNLARKLLGREWSVSPSAFHYAYAAVTSNAHLREVMIPESGGFSSGSFPLIPEREEWGRRCKLVKHNNITFVPKTAKTYRSIAVEPLWNGFLQKGIDDALRLRLKRIGIDLSAQEPNQEMARLGSFDDEDGFCTIDLSSASDSISKELVRELLPPDWFAFLDACRSKQFSYKGKVFPYEKFCSMGNGFCFPLQTLLFAAACVATRCGKPGIDFRVYGDDIVIRKRNFDALVSLLRYMGFKTNSDKTFSKGPFRESCGADWFGGKDVRPFTLDFALDSLENVFKFLNLTASKELWKSFFEGTRPYLLRLLPASLRLYRPYKGNVDTGIDSLGDEYLTSPNCTFDRRRRAWVWKELKVSPIEDNYYLLWGDAGLPALVCGALSGSASAMPFTLRRETKTKVRKVSHPGADSTWLPPTPVCYRGVEVPFTIPEFAPGR